MHYNLIVWFNKLGRKRGKLNYNEFIEEVREGLSAKLKPSYEIVLKKVAKNNNIYRYGLSVFPTGNNKTGKVSRIVYLEDFYQEYQENQIYNLENIVEELYGILLNFDTPEFKETDYTDIDKIKDRIIFELVNYKMNEERLSDRPFIKIMDLKEIIYIFAILSIVSIFSWWISLVLKYSKKKKLSEKDKKELKILFKKIKNLPSDKEKIVDYDKLYHQILKRFWYEWTFWEILKKKPNEISNLNKVWTLHKLRNTLVHEFDSSLKDGLSKRVKEYEKEIELILK